MRLSKSRVLLKIWRFVSLVLLLVREHLHLYLVAKLNYACEAQAERVARSILGNLGGEAMRSDVVQNIHPSMHA